jgi:hypothetical protein
MPEMVVPIPLTLPFFCAVLLCFILLPFYHTATDKATSLLLSGEKVTQKHFHTAAPLWRQYESAFARSRGFFSINLCFTIYNFFIKRIIMKKFVSMALALTVAASMAVPAFAASEPVAPQNEPTAATESVSPCIYWTGTAKLNTTDYVNITSSNNIFPDSPLVTSDANNPGNVTIRVINEKGAQVGETKTIAPGSSVRLDQIPAFSGTYTIQGKASVAGTYTFNID